MTIMTKTRTPAAETYYLSGGEKRSRMPNRSIQCDACSIGWCQRDL